MVFSINFFWFVSSYAASIRRKILGEGLVASLCLVVVGLVCPGEAACGLGIFWLLSFLGWTSGFGLDITCFVLFGWLSGLGLSRLSFVILPARVLFISISIIFKKKKERKEYEIF